MSEKITVTVGGSQVERVVRNVTKNSSGTTGTITFNGQELTVFRKSRSKVWNVQAQPGLVYA